MSQFDNINIKNYRLLIKITLFVFLMIGMSYASVPLYDLFCRVTGYGGTTQKSSLAPGSKGNYKNIQVRFDANVNNSLNWEFLAPKDEILVQPGVEKIIYYTAKNLSDKTIVGTATYNVSPPKAGSIFMKIDCFCFVEQTLLPGEKVKMPVVFYIDPMVDSDESLKNLSEITLSYTFFKKYEKQVNNSKNNFNLVNKL
tara:strand:+ start:255 stop:848 length:594 start_codon:yes stop_codon:yes gene_type:complete